MISKVRCTVLLLAIAAAPWSRAQLHDPDVPYVPTPPEMVNAMLKLAGVTKSDVVYDLGCGDGRVVIAAAKQIGARGVGIDIDQDRIREAQENADKAGVSNLVQFRLQDLFQGRYPRRHCGDDLSAAEHQSETQTKTLAGPQAR